MKHENNFHIPFRWYSALLEKISSSVARRRCRYVSRMYINYYAIVLALVKVRAAR